MSFQCVLYKKILSTGQGCVLLLYVSRQVSVIYFSVWKGFSQNTIETSERHIMGRFEGKPVVISSLIRPVMRKAFPCHGAIMEGYDT